MTSSDVAFKLINSLNTENNFALLILAVGQPLTMANSLLAGKNVYINPKERNKVFSGIPTLGPFLLSRTYAFISVDVMHSGLYRIKPGRATMMCMASLIAKKDKTHKPKCYMQMSVA